METPPLRVALDCPHHKGARPRAVAQVSFQTDGPPRLSVAEGQGRAPSLTENEPGSDEVVPTGETERYRKWRVIEPGGVAALSCREPQCDFHLEVAEPLLLALAQRHRDLGEDRVPLRP